MSNLIQLKRTVTPGNIPAAGNLAPGEVALNINDGKLFFKKTVSGVDSIVTLQQLNAGTGVNIVGGNINIGQDVGVTATPAFRGANISPVGYSNSLTVYSNGNVNIGYNLTLAGTVTDNKNSLGYSGQVLTSTGTGVEWKTNTTTEGAIIKTFNILNEFSGPLLGNAIFNPIVAATIRSVQLNNGNRVVGDLTIGLYRNSELLSFFTLPTGQYVARYTGLSFTVSTNDYFTVNVVSGNGLNFSLVLLSV